MIPERYSTGRGTHPGKTASPEVGAMKYGVNGTECMFASDGDDAKRRDMISEPKLSASARRLRFSFSFEPRWVILRATRLMYCRGHVQRVYAAASQPLTASP